MAYSRLNTFRNHAVCFARKTAEVRQVVEGVNKLLENVQAIAPSFFSRALESRLRSLKTWADGTQKLERIPELQELLNSMTVGEIWLEANTTIVAEFLVCAARRVYAGGDLPCQWLHTCFKILPELPPNLPEDFPLSLTTRHHIFLPGDRNTFHPSRNHSGSGRITSLDWIMRCFLRIVPLVRPEDAAPILTVYLAWRNDLKVLEFVTRECRQPVAMNYLVDTLPQRIDADKLLAIYTLLVEGQYEQHLRDWDDRAERLWVYIAEHNVLTTPSPLCLSLAALMKLRKQQHIRISTFDLLDPEHVNYEQSNRGLERLRRLTTDAALPGSPHEDDTREELGANIHIRGKQAMITALTEFLDACAQPVKPLHRSSVMFTLCDMLPGGFEAVDTQVMTRFAQLWVNLAHQLVENPTNVEMNSMTAHVFLWYGAQGFEFYHPVTAPIFKEALLIYLHFLEHTGGEEDYRVAEARGVLDEIVVRMAEDVAPATVEWFMLTWPGIIPPD
ncbi:hypothetical protein DFH09DRAFT_1392532 [Mycena vulgaris]|nr:hypothetical protein DFH09DRAFT_1392532 [Mycena vulgaris]